MDRLAGLWSSSRNPGSFISTSSAKLPWLGSGYLKSDSHQHHDDLKPAMKTASQAATIATLQTSFQPMDGVRSLQRHRVTWGDAQYIIIAAVLGFSACLAPLGVCMMLLGALLYALLLLMPATRQFFLPSLPIWTYLFYFFSSGYLPVEARPDISVNVLPAFETTIFGTTIARFLSAHTHPILDILAWIPYGLGHFGGPFVTAALLFHYAAPGTTPVFARTFGYLCILGVTIQLLVPCTPPWYETQHGSEPARYGMEGYAAGLARVDELLGTDLYTTSFRTQPVPFGAFPSMHSANATLHALFLGCCSFPRARVLLAGYVAWLWWSTMYLDHHYLIDIVAGSLLAGAFFAVARARFLPVRQDDKATRWQYEYVEVGTRRKLVDEEGGWGEQYNMGLLHEWVVSEESRESSSSMSSRSSTSSSSSSSLSRASSFD